MTLVGADGKYNNYEDFVVGSSAKVVKYNPTRTSERRVDADATMGDIFEYNTMTTDGDVDLINTAPKDRFFAFVRLVKDVVTEVMLVQYYAN